MAATTYDDVIELLGDIDDLFVERIIETGATTAEVAEALDDLEDQRRFGDERRPDASPQITAVRAILEEVLDDRDDDASPVLDAAP